MAKINNTYINELKEAFQTNSGSDDINGVFFDLSANYLKLLESEKAPVPPSVPDTVILDIGGAYGEYDASRIPWDAENKELLPGEALYGIVPSIVSAALFGKVDQANQLADLTSLPFDENTNTINYQSPEFEEDPDAVTKEEKDYEVATQVGGMMAVMLVSEFIETAFEEKSLRKGLKGGLTAPIDLLKLLLKPIDTYLFGSIGSRAAAGSLNYIKSLRTPIKPKELPKIVDNAKFVVKPKVSSKAGKAAASLVKGGAKIANKLSKTMLFQIAAIVAKKMGKLIMQILIKSIVLSVSLKAIPPVWFGAALGAAYDIIITPIILCLSLGGVVDKAIEKSADPEGCCPAGSIPLDSIIPTLLNDLLISNIPIIGDILGFFYPYVCSEIGTGRLVYKLTLTLPKYISYPWLSCYYLKWPDYNCRISGRAPVMGKRLVNGTYDWNNSGVGYYTNLSAIVTSPDSYKQDMVEMSMGKLVTKTPEYIVPPGKKFVYADFTEPQMLVDMAQFYYNWASKDPYPNDDGTLTIEYISKINYIAASSLYTCDANCEMVSITYDPLTGENYSETITYDRDRRFYYRVNTNVYAPPFWEDASDSSWRAKDDAYDIAINDLNSYIYQDRFDNTDLNAAVLTTAYRQMLDASNRLTFITNIASSNYANTGVTGKFDNTIREFNQSYIESQTALSNIPKTNLSGFTSNDYTPLLNKLSTIIGYSNDLWNYHKSRSASQIGTYVNNQYKLMGCTKIDATASSAASADPSNLEEDTRYFTNFNVLPYIKRCTDVNIDLAKCMDLSNIDLIIYNYYLQNPNKRIKSINSIKAKGRNACEFIWDEVTYNKTTKAETDFKKNVNTTILYQQDLSSCTFNLPPPAAISGSSNYLFGSQTGGTTTIEAPPASIKTFTNPVSSSDPNYSGYSNLTYKQAKYKYPILPTEAERSMLPVNQQNRPKEFIESNVDYVPRYDPATFSRLPDLVRPKKPIRIRYPNEDQAFLNNESNNYCSDPKTLKNIIMDYNGNSNNVNKIATIIRSFTSSSNTCDLEVDMYMKGSSNLQRKTITTNVKRKLESFQNPFTFDTMNSQSSGLNIDTSTDPLSNPYELGLNYGNPYLRSFQQEIGPNSAYFNDNLIKNFTDKTKNMRNANYRILQGLVGTQKLGNPTCNKRCSDDDIVQRIVEQYNKDGTPKTRYDASQNSIRQVVNSVTNSSNSCHVILDNKTEYYGDYYLNDKTSSNYASEFRLKLKKVTMKDAGNCTFYPVPNQIYQDISASDLALTSSSNFNVYKKPIRTDFVPVNCRDSSLYNAAFNDYKRLTGNTVDGLLQSMNIGTNVCDYLIESELNIKGVLIDSDNYVLRVTYDNTLYESGMNSNASVNNTYSYKPNSFKLQVPLELGEYISNTQYYELQDPEGTNASPLLSYDGTSSDPINPKINKTRITFS